MERKWTNAQLAAIESGGRDLLVSAGAGSGKTAVLTERIIRRLTDPNHPAEISRMLIVTFTRAAAGELRERILAAITDALAKNPADRRLTRQLYALDRAKICTIHSFCLDLLREGGTEIRGDFRIADEAEITLLRKNIMNELLEEYYADGVAEYPIENFGAFADTFVGTKSDDALAEVFLGIENALSSYTEHIAFIEAFAAELEADAQRPFGKSRCGAEIADLIRGRITANRAVFADALFEFQADDKLKRLYAPAFAADLTFIDAVAAARDFEAMQALFAGFTQERLGAARGIELSPEAENAKLVRTGFHEERKKLETKFFSLTPAQLAKNCIDTAAALRNLHTLLKAFLVRLEAEKKRRNLLDFGDLERRAYDLLVRDGKPTEIALAVSARFDEICIDEYQDVNAVQDAIFRAVSNGRNRFMVGDIKQSIYGFRGAEPGIFSAYRTGFGRLGDPELAQDHGASIFLSENFRCNQAVIDFANAVSGCLFTHGRGDIPFYPEDLLRHAKIGEEQTVPVRVVVISGEDSDENEDLSEREVEWTADEIARLLREGRKDDGTPIRPSDIAILMRSAKAHSAAFETAFRRRGIPFCSHVSGGFFENAEVLLALCILNIIDNPTRDIYLTGALRSPVFGFTLDELILIRRAHPEGCLYDALRSYTESRDFPKGRDFLATLNRWREKAPGMPIDRLIWYLYTDTDLPALVYGGDAVRRANLMLLYEYARRFEGSSFKGLCHFIRYINDILEEKATLEDASLNGEDSDAVRLMTIHQSKGLEFPVCFLCGAGRKFNTMDLNQNIVMERELGIALKLSDETGFARYDTPIRQAIVKRLSDTLLEEEMRVLYVAMTRARERLYVTGLVKKPEDFFAEIDTASENLTRYEILKNGGSLRWILLALAQHEGSLPCTVETVEAAVSDIPPDESPEDAPPELEADDALRRMTAERFDFVYPRARAARLPAKLSVSVLAPDILDEDAAALPEDAEPFDFAAKRPLFLDESAAADSAAAAERGTATHLFMQFCDFRRFADFTGDLHARVEEEAARLAAQRYITPRAASLVDVKRLAGFFTSSLFREICAARSVRREHRFNVKLPAADFTEDASLRDELAGETVLVQGVIDCFWENPDGTLTLLDYKTDRVPFGMSREDARDMLLSRHGRQLSYYRSALEKIACRKVSRVILWSFGMNAEILL